MGIDADKIKNEKLYYSIRDVSTMIGVAPSTLRYWEKEFEDLRPRTSPGGTRTYSIQDIDYLRLIASLLKDKKMKIDGAKRLLKSNRTELERKQQLIDKLTSIYNELLEIQSDFL